MSQVVLTPFWQVFDANGNPAAGAKASFFTAGISTPINVFSDSTLVTPHAVPVVADSQGRFPTIYAAAGNYKLKVTDSANVDLAPEVDNWTVLANLTQTILSFPTVTKTANYEVVAADRGKVIEVDPAGGTIIVTLKAATLGAGFPIWIINTGATGTVQLQFDGAETLLGAATYNLLNQFQSVGLTSRGAAGWALIAAYGFNFDTLVTFAQGLTVASGKPAKFQGPVIKTYTTLTDSGTIAWDMATGANFKVTITANRIFGAPTNLVEGQEGELLVIQDGTGGWIPTWTAPITFDGGPPNPKTTAASRTFYHYKVENSLVVLSRSDDIVLTQGTAVATTSGTSIDFTGIPAGVKRITIMLNGVSTNGTSDMLIQLGDSGGIETAGYVSSVFATGATNNSTAGFTFVTSTAAATTYTGSIILNLEDAANTWIEGGNVVGAVGVVHCSAGSKATSATLDRIRLTTAAGVNTFDLGSMNIMYE